MKILNPSFAGAIVLMLSATLFPINSAQAQDPDLKKWSFGVTYAGAGLGYRFSPRWSTEVRAQELSDVFVAGMRFNFHFRPLWGILPYFGVEGDYTSFTGEVTKGKGYAGEAFLGAEYYFAGAWSAVLDAGPAWISLKDDATAQTVDGMEGVINLGINYHFGREVAR